MIQPSNKSTLVDTFVIKIEHSCYRETTCNCCIMDCATLADVNCQNTFPREISPKGKCKQFHSFSHYKHHQGGVVHVFVTCPEDRRISLFPLIGNFLSHKNDSKTTGY